MSALRMLGLLGAFASLSAAASGASAMQVPDTIAVGEEVPGSIGVAAEVDTFVVDLAAGEAVDLALFSPDGSLDPRLEIWSPDGSRLVAENDDFRRGGHSLIPRLVPQDDGWHRIAARAYDSLATGSYVLKVRSAAPVAVTAPWGAMEASGVFGGLARDTLWIYNASEGSAGWQATDTLPWLTVSPSSGTLPAGSPASAAVSMSASSGESDADDPQLAVFQDPALAPDGSTRVVVTFDLAMAGLSSGVHWFDDAIRVGMSGDPWAGQASVSAQLWVHEASLSILASRLRNEVGDVVRDRLGDLVVATNGGVERVDPSTGARTVIATGLTPSNWGLEGIDVSPDGTIYVADRNGGAVKRVRQDGSVETVWSASQPYDVSVVVTPPPAPGPSAVVAGESLYVVEWASGLWHIDPSGVATNVVAGSGCCHEAVAYNPLDGLVYYNDGSEIHAYDPGIGSSSPYTTAPDTPTDIEFGASGLLYAMFWNGARSFDGLAWQSYSAPDDARGLALLDGQLVAATRGGRNDNGARGVIYSVPVADGPAVPSGAYLVADWPTLTVSTGGSAVQPVRVTSSDPVAALTVDDVSSSAAWLSVGPTSGTTPLDLTLTADASALAPGVYVETVTVTSGGAGNSPFDVAVTVNVGNTIALGDDVLASLSVAGEADTFLISLEPGQVVDLYADPTDGSTLPWLDLRVEDASGSMRAWGNWRQSLDNHSGSLVGAWTSSSVDPYRIIVANCCDSGAYVLKTRASGPIVAVQPWGWTRLSGRQGDATTSDTVWVHNYGRSPAAWEASSSYPWLTVNPTSGALAAAPAGVTPSAPTSGDPRLSPFGQPAQGEGGPQLALYDSPELAPAGSVPVVLTVDLGAFPVGASSFWDAAVFRLPADPWGGDAVLGLDVYVFQSDLRVVAEGLPPFTRDIARLPDGALVTAPSQSGELLRIDPVSGARSVVATGLGDVWGLAAAQDGTVYLAARHEWAVKRVATDGTVSTVWTGDGEVTDVTVLPDGTLYAATWANGLWRIDPDLTATNVAPGPGPRCCNAAVGFNPIDGFVYHTRGHDLLRHDRGTGTSTFVRNVQDEVLDLDVGTSGRLYAMTWRGIRVLTTGGIQVDQLAIPDQGYGLAVLDGGVYGTVEGCCDGSRYDALVYEIPVDDGYVSPTGTYLDVQALRMLVPSGGGTLATMPVRTNDATPVGFRVTTDAPWLTPAPDTADTPFDIDLTADGSAVAPGVYGQTVTLTSDLAGNSPLNVPVNVFVGGVVAFDGPPTSGTLGDPARADTFYVDLPDGAQVDIAAFPTGGEINNLNVLVMDGNGNHQRWGDWRPLPGGTSGRVIPGWTVVGPGPHRIMVENCCEGTGTYEVKARTSAPIVASDPWSNLTLGVPEGAAQAVDTVWVYSLSGGVAGWEATTTVPGMTLVPSSGSFPGASPAAEAVAEASARAKEYDATLRAWMESGEAAGVAPPQIGVVTEPSLAPPGSVPVVVTVDVAGLVKGWQFFEDAIVVAVPGDSWAGDAVVDVEMYVHEPTIAVVAAGMPNSTGDVARLPDGDLVVATGGNLERVDPDTGARSLFAAGASQPWALRGVAVAPDGSVYFVDAWRQEVRRALPDGSVSSVWAIGGDDLQDVAVAPDGTVYALAHSSGLWRIGGGSVSNVAGNGCCHRAVAFNPLDGMVYYGHQHRLRRYDPVSGTNVQLPGGAWGWINDLEVGASGMLYAANSRPSAYITVHDSEGIRRGRYHAPEEGWGLALLDGRLIATTPGCCENHADEGLVYELPVADEPVGLGGRYLVAEGLPTYTPPVGQVIADTITVSASDGTAIVFNAAWNAPWLSVSPASGTTPRAVVLTVNPNGLSGGSHVDTLVFTSASAAAVMRRVVTLVVPSTLAVGDEILGTIPVDRGSQEQLLSLTSGDVVDIGVFQAPGSDAVPNLVIRNPDGTFAAGGQSRPPLNRGSAAGHVFAAFEATQTGPHGIIVQGGSGSAYVLKTRLVGDLVAADPQLPVLWAPAGGAPVADTIYLYNPGPNPLAWEIAGGVGGLPSWLTVSKASGTLSPGVLPSPDAWPGELDPSASEGWDPRLIPLEPQLVTARPPPVGADTLIVTFDPAGFTQGTTLAHDIEIVAPAATAFGGQLVTAQASVADPSFTILTAIPYRQMYLEVYSPTELVATRNRDLWKIDRASGAATPWVENLAPSCDNYPSPPYGIAHAGDGAVYVADQCAHVIYRVEPDGTSSTVMTIPSSTPYEPVVLPDGTLVASTGAGIFRREADGSATLLVGDGGLKSSVYNPIDGWLYYVLRAPRQLKRVHPWTRAVETLGTVPPNTIRLKLAANGTFYALGAGSVVYVLDGSGAVLTQYGPSVPFSGFGLTLGAEGEDVMYTSTQGFIGGNGHVFSRTVPDHAARFLMAEPRTVLVMEGGAAMDTLRVQASDATVQGFRAVASEPWLTLSPDTADTPSDIVLTVDASGLAAGTYEATVTLTSAGAAAPYALPVRVSVGGVVAYGGDPVVGAFDAPNQADTFYVSLPQGEYVDVAAFPTPGSGLPWIDLLVMDDDGNHHRWGAWRPLPGGTSGSVIGRWQVSGPTPHRIVVHSCCTGAYEVKARPSGPIVATDPWSFMTMRAPAGGPAAVDTVWVYNFGSGSADWEVVSTQPWLVASPAGGPLPGPSPSGLMGSSGVGAGTSHEPDLTRPVRDAEGAQAGPALAVYSEPRLAPPGSTPVVITADVAGMPKGVRYVEDALVFRIPTDPWGGEARIDVELYVHEPTMTVVAGGFENLTGDVARMADGSVVVATGGDLARVNPATGTRTILGGVAPNSALGVAAAPDGSVYVVDFPNRTIDRVAPNGAVQSIWTLEGDQLYDVTVTDAGKLYAVGWATGVWWIDPVLLEARHVTQGGAPSSHRAVHFSPVDGLVYFSQGSGLHSYDPATGVTEALRGFGGAIRDIDVGASGVLYAHTSFTIDAVGADMRLLARYAVPGFGWGIAVMDGALLATTNGCCDNILDEGILYRLPVPDEPATLGGRYLVADQVRLFSLRPDEAASDTVELTTNDLSSALIAVTSSAPWLTVAATPDRTPAQVVFTTDATGLAGGSYADTVVFTSDIADADLVRIVRLDVASVLAAGDSVVGRIPLDRGSQRQLLSLTADQVVDVGAFEAGGGGGLGDLLVSGPDSTLLRIGRRRVSPNGSLVSAFRAPVGGTYEVRVNGASGSGYILKTRLAGDVVTSEPEGLDMWAPGAGGPVTDTLWLHNTGGGSPAWELANAPPEWLTVSVSSGTLNPAASPAASPLASGPAEGGPAADGLMPLSPQLVTRRPPPAGAQMVIVTADPTGMAAGQTRFAELEVRPVGGSAYGSQPVEVRLRAVDPALTVVTPIPYRLMDVDVYSGTELLATTGRDLWKIDRATGAATVWVPDLGIDAGTYPSPLLGIVQAADGAIYVADQSAPAIYRVEADGTPSTVMALESTTYDPVLLPDGTLIAATFAGFFRRERDGSVRLLAEDASLKRSVYNPLNGWIYYSQWAEGALKRVHPSSGRIETVAQAGALTDLHVGASGRIYAATPGGPILVYSAGGEVLETLGGPLRSGFGVALGASGEDVLYVSSQGLPGGNGHVYRRARADFRAPMPATPTVTAWIEDGAAFNADTVTVGVYVDLSSTGKALGALNASVHWDPSKAELVSVARGAFSGSFDTNVLGADSGKVSFAGINVSDTANTGETRVAELRFVLTAPGGESVLVGLSVGSLESTDFTSLMQGMWVRDGIATVATGFWGDPSGDSRITAFDALVCLTQTVGRPLPPEARPSACDVAPDLDEDGDGTRETFDGTVTALDALAILSHVVEKALPPEFRPGRLR